MRWLTRTCICVVVAASSIVLVPWFGVLVPVYAVVVVLNLGTGEAVVAAFVR